jgi:hypothetical protein
LIDIVHHAKEGGGVFLLGLVLVDGLVFWLGVVGGVRGVGGDPAEEGFVLLAGDPLFCLVEEDVCAVAFGVLKLAIVQDVRVKIRVVWRVTTAAGVALSYAACAVDKDFIKAASPRCHLPKMPVW